MRFSVLSILAYSCVCTIGDVSIDGEVSVHQPHLVLKLLLNTIEQILDVAAHGAQVGNLLRLRKVHASPHFCASICHVELNGQVFEITLERAMFACHLYLFCFNCDLDTLG